jgi:hypothetical protein
LLVFDLGVTLSLSLSLFPPKESKSKPPPPPPPPRDPTMPTVVVDVLMLWKLLGRESSKTQKHT